MVTLDKMNFNSDLYKAVNKLKSTKEQGEFLMAVFKLFFENEETELTGGPDLLMDGWHDRILKMREGAINSKKSKNNDDLPTVPPQGDHSRDPQGVPITTPQGDPLERIEYIDNSIKNKDLSYSSSSNLCIETHEEKNNNNFSCSVPNIYPILNPKESPLIANPPEVEAVYEYGRTNIDSLFTQEEAQAFIDYYDGIGWVYGRNHQPIRKWQTFLKSWIEHGKKIKQEQKQQEQKHQEGMVMSDAEFDRYLEQKLAQYEEPPRFNADGTYADASRAS